METFLPHFLPNIVLISVFCSTDGAAMISLFYLPVTSIHTGAHDDRHCVRESAHGRGTSEDKLLSCPGSNPGRLCARQVLYPLCNAPWAGMESLFSVKVNFSEKVQ